VNNNKIKIITIITRIILSIIILFSGISLIFSPIEYKEGLYVIIILSASLLSLSMIYNISKGEERNAGDIMFFSYPTVIIVLFLIGLTANDSDVWIYISISLGGIFGLGFISYSISGVINVYFSRKSNTEEDEYKRNLLGSKISNNSRSTQ